MCAKPKKQYTQYTIYLDPEIEEDIEIIAWLKTKRKSRNSYSSQIRKSLKKIIDEEKLLNGGKG
jgi:hypothetical protein